MTVALISSLCFALEVTTCFDPNGSSLGCYKQKIWKMLFE